MTDVPFWLAAILSGFFGSTHCVGMCGGIAGVLTHSVRHHESSSLPVLQFGFHLGRITSYVLLAFALSAVVQTVGSLTQLQWWADATRALAALMLILMGLYLTRWWTGLTTLERYGATLWRRLQPLFLRRSSAMRQHFASALFSGVLWGLLPCGLVYSALLTAGLQTTWFDSGIFMVLFGVGTIPALLLSASLLRTAADLERWRQLGGVVLIAFGAMVLWHLLPTLFSVPSDIYQSNHSHHLPPT